MVTGVHLISNGRVHSGWNVGLDMQGGISVDARTSAGRTPTGTSAADAPDLLRRNIQMETLYGQSGERVWRAQFMELAVDFTNGPQRHESQGWSTRLFTGEGGRGRGPRCRLAVSGVHRRATLEESPSLIDWEKHQAIIVGMQTTGYDIETTDDNTVTIMERPDNDGPRY
ncbi:hypothetical protein F5Y03DRAFT_403726 [Xylaria venustula]|nr:hypothetical protein F5Y03DRAFT_403726 [Xylaria venustula]